MASMAQFKFVESSFDDPTKNKRFAQDAAISASCRTTVTSLRTIRYIKNLIS